MLVAIFGVGGALRGVQAAVAILVALSLAPRVWSRREFARPSPLSVFLGLAALLCAVQLVPLPRGLLFVLEPTGAGLREDGALLLGTAPATCSSLDVPGTLRGLAFFVILLGFAMHALRIATTERGRFQLLALVGALLGLVAVVVGLHHVFGATSLFGVYEFHHVGPHLIGPLLNLNHLGCAMAMGTVLAIGLAAYRRQPTWARVGWLTVACAAGSVTVATVSRGATISLVAGALVTVAVLLGQHLRGGSSEVPKRRTATFLTSSLPIGVVAACVVVLVVYTSASNVGHQLANTSFDEVSHSNTKFAAWRSAMTLIEEAPWLGNGRGAFEAAFTHVHPASGTVTFSHVENEYLQAIVDWGVPGAILLGITAIWFAVVALRKWRDGPLVAAALGAIVVVIAQSNVDFGIELLGIAIPLTAVAATLSYVPLREVTARRLAIARGVRVGQLVMLVVGALLLLSSATTSIDDEHEALQERSSTFDDLRAAAERHPLDYFVYARAAEVMMRRNDPLGVRLLNHALMLHPTHPGLHRLAARLLFNTGHLQQAALEYATALRVEKSPESLLTEIVAVFPPELAAAAIPADDPQIDLVVATLDRLRHPEVTTIWLGRVLELGTNNARACDLVYANVMQHAEPRAAELAARRCAKLLPDRGARFALAEVLMRQQSYAEVVKLLDDVESWPGRRDEKVRAWLVRCDALAAIGEPDAVKKCLRRLGTSGDVTEDQRGAITSRLQTLEAAQRARDLDVPPP